MFSIFTQRSSAMKKTIKTLLTISALAFINIANAVAPDASSITTETPAPTEEIINKPEPKKVNRCGTHEPTSAEIETNKKVIDALIKKQNNIKMKNEK